MPAIPIRLVDEKGVAGVSAWIAATAQGAAAVLMYDDDRGTG